MLANRLSTVRRCSEVWVQQVADGRRAGPWSETLALEVWRYYKTLRRTEETHESLSQDKRCSTEPGTCHDNADPHDVVVDCLRYNQRQLFLASEISELETRRFIYLKFAGMGGMEGTKGGKCLLPHPSLFGQYTGLSHQGQQPESAQATVLYLNLPGGTERKHEIICLDSRCPGPQIMELFIKQFCPASRP
jgi:hypothetical protein